MKNNRTTTLIASAVTTAVLGLSANDAFADSAVVFNAANSHYYQRFDIANINWNTAKGNCETLKGHLVTIPGDGTNTNPPEDTFVFSQLTSKAPAGSNVYYFTGAYFSSTTGTWAWVTGEPWGWGSTSPAINGYAYYALYSGSDSWYRKPIQGNGGSSNTNGYICEWDNNNFVATATVPDLNGNGVDEIASLYLNQLNNRHTIKIRDPKTHVTLSTLTFTTDTTPPIGLAVIADINGNNIPEIAVLSKLNVKIKDAKNNAVILKSINFLNSTYQPRALSARPDSNGNGFDELTVLGTLQNGKTTSQTRDSSTGLVLFTDTF